MDYCSNETFLKQSSVISNLGSVLDLPSCNQPGHKSIERSLPCTLKSAARNVITLVSWSLSYDERQRLIALFSLSSNFCNLLPLKSLIKAMLVCSNCARTRSYLEFLCILARRVSFWYSRAIARVNDSAWRECFCHVKVTCDGNHFHDEILEFEWFVACSTQLFWQMNNQGIELRHLESICVTCLVYLATSFSLKPYHQIEKANKPWEK